MSSVEELAAKIDAKGQEIRELKAAGTAKDALKPHIDELLLLKGTYKTLTGSDFKPPASEKKEEKKKAPALNPAEAPDPNKKSKKQLQREKKEAEKMAAKAAAKEERERKQAEASARGSAAETGPEGQEWRYGDLPLIQSSEITGRQFSSIRDLTPAKSGQEIWLRARVHATRSLKKGAFLVLRQSIYTVQATVFVEGNVGRPMVQYAEEISKESVVRVRGKVVKVPSPVSGCTQKEVELKIEEIHVVSAADTFLPLLVADAMRPDLTPEEEEKAENDKDGKVPTVSADTRLDHRWIDLRTPANHAIFKIQSAICQYFRDYLGSKGFVEIHSPKLSAGASEGGSEVFMTDYFGQPACLAQSPQLYKQIAAACSGFERVMEVGPVFRAEKSRTHRHLCEFTGLDFEMVIKEHYFEVLEVLSNLFMHIFDELNRCCSSEIEAVRQQHPFEDLRYARPTLRLTFREGIQLLRDAGYDADPMGDLSTEHEKKLGDLVAERYGTDFFIMDKYPLEVRPFYTMPCPENPALSNSFDVFIRGEEIISGAQRVHDLSLLETRAKAKGIPLESLASYLAAFKHGAEPHGGGGIGLERVVMLFLGLKNIRKTSMFPRDPKRCAP